MCSVHPLAAWPSFKSLLKRKTRKILRVIEEKKERLLQHYHNEVSLFRETLNKLIFSSQNAELVLVLLRSTQTIKFKAVCVFFNPTQRCSSIWCCSFDSYLSVYMFCVIKLTWCSPPSASFEHAISLSPTLSLLFTMLADNYKYF